jgi:hypothetical protein
MDVVLTMEPALPHGEKIAGIPYAASSAPSVKKASEAFFGVWTFGVWNLPRQPQPPR